MTAAIARRRGERREVARDHLRRRDELDVVRRQLTPDRALIRAEEEQLVSHDRPTECSAELIALQPIVLALAVGTDRRKRARRVEAVVAQELERGPGKPVRARLGHRADGRA